MVSEGFEEYSFIPAATDDGQTFTGLLDDFGTDSEGLSVAPASVNRRRVSPLHQNSVVDLPMLSAQEVLQLNATILELIQKAKTERPQAFLRAGSDVVSFAGSQGAANMRAEVQAEEVKRGARESRDGQRLRIAEEVQTQEATKPRAKGISFEPAALATEPKPAPSSKSEASFGGSSIASGASFGGRRRRAEASSNEITQAALGESVTLRQEAERFFGSAAAMPEEQAARNAILGKEVQDKLAKRIERDEKLAMCLEKRLHSVEPIIYLLEQCLQDLERTNRNFWPQVSVANQRRKLREQCPTGELDKDYLQQALRYEQRRVHRGRKQLVKAKEEGTELLNELHARFKEGQDALSRKRFAAAHDKTCLKVSLQQHGLKHAVSTELLKDSKKVEMDRESWAASVKELLQQVGELETQAKSYREAMYDFVADKKKIADDAAAQTQDLFKKHTVEMHRLRRLIEKEMHESEIVMTSVQQQIAQTKRQIQKLKKPVNTAEQTLQTATASPMHRDRSTLVSSIKSNFDRATGQKDALEKQLGWAQALLNDLRNAHTQLEDDYEMKGAAMQYTDRCLLVMPKPEDDPRTATSRAALRARMERTPQITDAIKPSQIEELRRRMRAALPAGYAGQPDVDAFLRKVNPQNIGHVTDQQVKMAMRKILRVGHDFISDSQITSFCALLDEDGSGAVGVKELRSFIEKEPALDVDLNGYRTDILTAREKQQLAETQERPARDAVPILKNSQLQILKQRIKGAAWIAAHEHPEIEVNTDDDQVRVLFELYDKDGSGQLEDLEVKKALRFGLKIPKGVLSDSEIWSLIHILDFNDSGKVCVDELVNWVHDI